MPLADVIEQAILGAGRLTFVRTQQMFYLSFFSDCPRVKQRESSGGFSARITFFQSSAALIRAKGPKGMACSLKKYAFQIFPCRTSYLIAEGTGVW